MTDTTTADMLEIVASGGNGSELVELPAIMSKAAKELREKDARIAELEAERDAWKANAIACGKMLQSFTPGGSEYFGREINGAFPTDSEACGAVIRGKMESLHEARKSVVLIGRERDAALARIAELEAETLRWRWGTRWNKVRSTATRQHTEAERALKGGKDDGST